ncbi:hypothetical protein KKH30_04595 [Candidatus Micrarchaeota archaeon]|nr:hypothetical protein [Candidatus Micrarchaeota archaeon]
MDETTFRILDVLARNLGIALSINELTSKIKRTYGTAYYKNIYDSIQKLKSKKILDLAENGNASISSLNFNNYLITDMLVEMELKRKTEFLEKRAEFTQLFRDIEFHFSRGFYFIDSISLIRSEKNARLKRAEFLFLLRAPSGTEENGGELLLNETKAANSLMQMLEKRHNMKLDRLIIGNTEFLNLLGQNQKNPAREMLADKITFSGMQSFWADIGYAITGGRRISADSGETNPAKINENDLIYNLSEFGYGETGSKITAGTDICIETIIISLLLKGSARRTEAIPVLLAKNEINYNLLIFLGGKYGKLTKLTGLLEAFYAIKKEKHAKYALELLRHISTAEKADLKSIKQTMRLYNAD